MSTVRRGGGQWLEVKGGGGCLSLFGLPFFLAGLLVTAMGLQILRPENADDVPLWAWPLLVVMGLVFVGVGGWLVFGRTWTLLDGRRRLVAKRWGLLAPMGGKMVSADSFQAVALRHEPGDSETAERFPVRLRSASPGGDLGIDSPTDHGEAWDLAVEAARVLELPFEDATGERPLRLAPEQAVKSFVDRLRQGDGQTELPPPPANPVARITFEAGLLTVLLPPPRLGRGGWLAGLVPLAMAAVFLPKLARFFRATQTPTVVGVVFLGFLGFFFGVLPLVGMLSQYRRQRRGGMRVRVDGQGVIIEERLAWSTRRQQIEAADIWGIDGGTVAGELSAITREAHQRGAARPADATAGEARAPLSPRLDRMLAGLARLAKSRGVLLKTRQGVIPLGAGLADDEIRYLRALIERALAGNGGPEATRGG